MSKERLKIVPQYIKNVSKSLVYTGGDIVKQIMPNMANFTTTNSEVYKSVTTDLRNMRSIVKQTNTQFQNSEINKTVKNIKRNFMDDLKTGKWYNKQRNEKAELEASGFGDLFDFDDFDLDFNEDEISEPNLSTADKVQAKVGMSTTNAVAAGTQATLSGMKQSATMIAASNMESADYIVKNQNNIHSINTVNQHKMFNEINGVLNDIATNIRGLFQYTQNITTYFNTSAKIYGDMSLRLNEMTALTKEFTEMQRNLYKEYDKSRQYNYKDDPNSFMMNGFDIKEYAKSVKKRAKETYDNSMFGAMTGMMGGGSNMMKLFEGSPIKFLLSAAGKKAMSKSLNKSMESLDKTFGTFFENMMFKFSSTMKAKYEEQFNPLYEYAYKIFGLDLGEKKYTRTDKYIKGPVPYNGYADKSITEVIPTYLRKILAAITGQKEMIYDYSTGKFKSETDVQKAYESENKSTYLGASSLKYDIKSRIERKYAFNKSDQKELENNIDDFIAFVIDNGHFLNPNKDTVDSLRNRGYYGNNNITELILGSLKSMNKQKLMRYNKENIEAIRTRERMVDEMNKNIDKKGFSALFNGFTSSKNKVNPMSLSYKDDYNKSVFDYLRDIRQVLLEGIKTYSVNISGKKAKRVSDTSTNYDTRMKKYASEKRRLETASESYFEDEERERKNAEASGKVFTDLYTLTGDSSYYASQFADVSENTLRDSKSYSLAKKLGLKLPSSLMAPAKVAKDVVNAPQRVLVNLFDSINDNLVYLVFGAEDENGKNIIERSMDNANKMFNKSINYINDRIINPIKDSLLGERGLITNLKKRFSPVVENIKNQGSAFLGNISTNFFGVSANKMSPREFYNNHIGPRMKQVGLGAGAGLALSFVSPLGIIGGPLMGAVTGLALTSNRIKDKLFGKIGADGERIGGIVPKNILQQLQSSLKPMGIGAGIGALTGLVTPLGIIGSTLFGGAMGFVSNLDKVKNALFGEVGDNGERIGGIISKEWQDKFKEYKGSMLKGAGIGAFASLFLPGGPVGGAILGLAGGIASQSNKVKTFLFGKEDPEDGKRYGGLFGKMKEWIRLEVVEPMKIFAEEMVAKAGHFFKKHMLNPFLDSLAPLKKQFGLMKDSMVEQIKGGWQTTKDFIGGVFEKQVGTPFGQLMREKFIDPMKNLFTKLFSKLGSGLGKILAAPFKAINGKAMDYMDGHVMNGDDEYYGEWTRSKTARDKKTEDEYNAKMKSIRNKKNKWKNRRDSMEKENFSDEAIAKRSKERQAERQIWLQENANTTAGKIYSAANESLNVLKSIYNELRKAVSGATSDIASGIKNSIKFNARKKAHDAKHVVNTPNVINLGGTNSHASGLDAVPEDEYNANLHEGEMIIPADEANEIRRGLGLPPHKASKKKGPKNNSNRLVNNISNIIGSNKILNKIYDKVTNIYDMMTDKKYQEDNQSTSGILKDIKRNTKNIADELSGQITNVGYNVEYIARILEDQFGKPSVMPKGVRMGTHIVKGFFGKLFGRFKNLITKPFDFIKGLMSPITNTIKAMVDSANKALQTLVQIPKAMFDMIGKIGKGVLDVTKEVASVAGNVLKNIAQSIPSIVSTIASAAKATIKTVGELTLNVAKGFGGAIANVTKATGKLAGQFIELSAKVIPKLISGTWSLIKKVGGFVKNVATGIGSKILGFFGKGRKEKTYKKIAEIKLVELVKRVNTIDRIVSIGSIERINDDRIHNKLDKLISVMSTTTNGGGTQVNNFMNNEREEAGTSNSIMSLARHENNDNDFGTRKNLQFQKFQDKEMAETTGKQMKEFTALQKESFNANIKTNKLLSNAFGGKGLFSLLATAFEWLVPKLSDFKDRIINLGGKLYDKLWNKFGGKFPSIKKLFGKDGTIGKWGAKLWGYLQNIIASIKQQNFGDALENLKNMKKGGRQISIGNGNSLSLGNGSKTPNKNIGKYLLGEAAESTAENTGKRFLLTAGTEAAEDVVENTGKKSFKNIISNFAKKGKGGKFTKIFANIGMDVAEDAFEGSAKSTLKNTVKKAATSIPKNSKIINKIMNCSAVKKLVGGKIGKILGKLGKFLTEKMAKAGAKIFGKLAAKWGFLLGSGGLSAGIVPAIWIGASLVNGISATNRIFQVSPSYKPSMLMRTIAGFANFLENNVTFGIVSATTMANFMGSLLLSDKDLKGIDEANEKLNEEYEQYKSKKGNENVTFDEYNGEVVNQSLGTKIWSKTKETFSKISDGIGKGLNTVDNGLGSLFGLEDEKGNPIKFTSWAKDKASDAWGWVKEKSSGAMKAAKNVWSKTKKTMGKISDGIKEGLDTVNAGIGAMFGLEDEDGNKINFTTWAKNKASGAWDWVKDKASGTMKAAKNVWSKTKKTFSKMKEGISDGLDTVNAGIGSMLGLEDEDGNPVNFTTWAKNKASGAWDSIKNAASSTVDWAKDTWSSMKNKFGEWKDKIGDGLSSLNKNLGSMLGLEDEKGNTMSLTDYAKDKASKAWDGIKKGAKKAKESAGKVWDWCGEKLSETWKSVKKNAKKLTSNLNKGIGSLFGFEDEDGNSQSFTEGISEWWNDEVVSRKSNTKKKKKKSNKKKNAGNGFGATNTRKINAGLGEGYTPEKVQGAAYWSQNDSRWSNENYGTASIGASGCGPTSAAMLLTSVTGKTVTPVEAAQFSLKNGHRIPNQGTAWSFFPAIGKAYGISLEQQSNMDAFKQRLKEGYPAILSGTGSVPFTKSGHLIMATGLSSDGKTININDPVSKERSKGYSIDSVLSNTRAVWQSSAKLKDGAYSASSSSGSDSSDSSSSGSDDNDFASKIAKLGTYTDGFISSVLSGEVFDPSKLEAQDQETGSSVTTGTSNYSGTPSQYDFNWSSISPKGKSTNGNTVYGSDAIRKLGLTNQGFIDLIAPQAKANQKEFGIPASTTIAQAILESGWGSSLIGNNMFGIKEGSGYSGPVVSTKTSEYGSGGAYSTSANFRGYNTISAAIHDHGAKVIKGNPQWYSDVITSDWRKSVEGLSEYATDPSYISKLKSTITANDLTKYNAGNGEGTATQTRKPLDSAKMILSQMRTANIKLNDSIIASDMANGNTTDLVMSKVLQLLQNISDNTDTIANGTVEIASNTRNIGSVSSNTDNGTKTNVKNNKEVNALAKSTANTASSSIASAYANAKKIASGVMA